MVIISARLGVVSKRELSSLHATNATVDGHTAENRSTATHNNKTSINKDEKITIFVQGTRYETYQSTLALYPNTLLGDTDCRMNYYSHRLRSLYFDVKPELFEAVLFFYQSNGILAKPAFSTEAEYTHTLEFFGLAKAKQLDIEYTVNRTWRGRLWQVLEQPQKSRTGMCFAYFSFAVIFISVVLFCLETEVLEDRPPFYRFRSNWFLMECVYIAFFTLEYMTRLWSSPNRLKFAVSFLGLIDLFSVIPFFIAVISQRYAKISYLRILRLLQILRILKLSRYNLGLRILAQAILACRRQMFSLLVLFGIAIVFSSTLLYYFEHDNNVSVNGFNSIPEVMWFAVISMTTVGYGDVVPKTTAGKFVGSICIFLGTVVLFHLFLPIYLMYFSYFYRQHEAKHKLQHAHDHRKHRKGLVNYSSSSSSDSKSPEMNHTKKSIGVTPRSPVSPTDTTDTTSLDIRLYDIENFELTVPVRSINSGTSSYLRSGSFL